MTDALLLIDIQNDYFDGGAFPLPNIAVAAANAAILLTWARQKGIRIVHVRHEENDPATGFLLAGSPGTGIHPSVAPAPGETVVTKHYPNAFRNTALREHLEGVDHLLVVGAMSNMCVDASARAAFDLGFRLTVVEDACAASDLDFNGRTIPDPVVHGAFMAALASAYGQVATTRTIVGG